MAAALGIMILIGFIIMLYGCIKINTNYDMLISDWEQEAYLNMINKKKS